MDYTNKEIAAIFINNSKIKIEFEGRDFQTLAHEFTHIITNGVVNWSRENFLQKNEAQCINEAYSDLFAMIIDWNINKKMENKPFEWVYRTDIANTQYPKKNRNG